RGRELAAVERAGLEGLELRLLRAVRDARRAGEEGEVLLVEHRDDHAVAQAAEEQRALRVVRRLGLEVRELERDLDIGAGDLRPRRLDGARRGERRERRQESERGGADHGHEDTARRASGCPLSFSTALRVLRVSAVLLKSLRPAKRT